MKKTSTLAALVLVIAPALSVAGLYSAGAVSIATATARGSITGARISANTLDYIDCYVTTNSITSGFPNSGHCTARDSFGTFAQCATTEYEMMKTMLAITAVSDVRFSWDAAGKCTTIFVRNASFNVE